MEVLLTGTAEMPFLFLSPPQRGSALPQAAGQTRRTLSPRGGKGGGIGGERHPQSSRKVHKKRPPTMDSPYEPGTIVPVGGVCNADPAPF